MLTNYKKLSGHQLRKRWEQVSGIKLNENDSHHLHRDKDLVVDISTLTYNELDKLIDDRIKMYFNNTFEELDVRGITPDEDEDLDKELQEILDELEYSL